MNKTYKFRLYPNNEQKDILQKTLNTCRFIYNIALEDRINCYQRTGKGLSYYDQAQWLKELDNNIYSQVIQDVLIRLNKAYDNFFRRGDFKWGMRLPVHLGYNNFAVYTEMTKQHYLLLTKFDLVMYERRGELSKDDLNRIESDKHFNAIYSNGEYNIYSSVDI